jgi:2-amino-4-hydroxy-6-hydroxymethyldihydropteridine diphosphokinase
VAQHTAYIGLGSNLGERERNLSLAVEMLSAYGTIEQQSSIYETEPVDYTNQPNFLNQVIALRTDLEPMALLQCCLGIECALGRERPFDKGPRTIDLDLLLYDDLIMNVAEQDIQLIVPHPRLHLRRFVLVPLCEIFADGIHPVIGMSFGQLLAELADEAKVWRWPHAEM